MMNPKILLFITGVTALPLLTACGYIKSLFPDKEKDYQYTSEIPDLVIPADLVESPVSGGEPAASSRAVEDKPVAAEEPKLSANTEPALPEGVVVPPRQGFPGHHTEAASSAADTATTTASAAEPAAPETHEPQITPEPKADTAVSDRPAPVTESPETPEVDLKKANVSLTKFTSNTNHFLRLGLPLRKAWLMVGKALTHNSVEVTLRNQDEWLYAVQFDPDEKPPVEDEGITDEINFLFGGFDGHEKEFALKLIENKDQTDVVVVDKEQQQPLPDSVGLKLLVLLEETIKADLAK